MISTVTLTLDLTNKKGRVTDTTDYSALGISLATFEAKGLGTIYFQGQVIESKTLINSPMIDLQSGATYFEFDLELDVNGEIANGVYKVDYSLRLNTYPVDFGIETTTPPSTITVDGAFAWLASFLEEGDVMRLYNLAPVVEYQTVNVVSCQEVAGNVEIVFEEVIDNTYSVWKLDITNLQSSISYTYSGCDKTTAAINFTYDCEYAPNGSFSVSSATKLTNQTIEGTTAIINYPSWTSSNNSFNPKITTGTLPYTQNALATGTYSVKLSQLIQQVQEDDLILQYTSSVTEEFKVTCTGSLCGLNACIESLRAAHVAELKSNKVSKYQQYVDNVVMYYAEAQTYKTCGDFDQYNTSLNKIKEQLDSSGCDCSCCNDDVYEWISVNTNSTIESLINAIQYKLKDGEPDENDDESVGVEIGAIWQDTTTAKLYRCTDNTAGFATWAVYYDPSSIIVTASGVTSNAQVGGVVLGTNVQANIDSINTALIDANDGIASILSDISDINASLNSKVESVTGTAVNNADPQNPIINDPSATDVSYSATINGATITTVHGALEQLKSSYSNYSNSLLYYAGIGNVSNTLGAITTAKVALRISSGGAIQMVGNNAYDPASASPTFTLQVDNSYTLAFPTNFMNATYTIIHVTPLVNADNIQIKASTLTANTVKIAFYSGGSIGSTISPCQVTIEVFR